nr:hypothetical protein [uncultured Chitinophaga sp.]
MVNGARPIKEFAAGGQQETAQQILVQLKHDNQGNDSVQDRIDDILDMVTGWCAPDMRAW